MPASLIATLMPLYSRRIVNLTQQTESVHERTALQPTQLVDRKSLLQMPTEYHDIVPNTMLGGWYLKQYSTTGAYNVKSKTRICNSTLALGFP